MRVRLMLLLLLAAVPARAEPRDPLATVRGSDTLALAHMAWEPAAEKAARLEGGGGYRQLGGARLWGPTRRRFAQLLGRPQGFVPAPDCTPSCPSCANAATLWLRFTTRTDTTMVTVLMRERRARYVVGGRMVGYRRLGRGVDTLLALARRALPHDRALVALKPAAWPTLDEQRVPEVDETVPVDSLPDPVVKGIPDYPDQARTQKVEGTVWCRVLVDPAGAVKEVVILTSLPALDDAARAAFRTWRFRPALCGEERVWCWITIPMSFRLH